MSDTFNALLISRDKDKKQSVDWAEMTDDQLMEGDVTVAVEATTVTTADWRFRAAAFPATESAARCA